MAVLIIFPVILQTVINLIMVSIGGRDMSQQPKSTKLTVMQGHLHTDYKPTRKIQV